MKFFVAFAIAAVPVAGLVAQSGTIESTVKTKIEVKDGKEIVVTGCLERNPSGGLIADGHPVGATGVRQVWEAYRQLTATAGERQINNARRFLTFNMGGSMTTNVCMIWGK